MDTHYELPQHTLSSSGRPAPSPRCRLVPPSVEIGGLKHHSADMTAAPPVRGDGRLRRAGLWMLAGAALFATAMGALQPLVELNIRGDFRGIYLLHGQKKRFVLTDDLHLDEPPRVLFGISFELASRLHNFFRHRWLPLPHLRYEWNAGNGTGYVENHLDATRDILTCFSRFEDAGGVVTSGVFVGGGLPYSRWADPSLIQNRTGMAYYNGRRWFHLWCTVNESLASARQAGHLSYPSSWPFLGSEVIRGTPEEVVITSAHETAVDGVPLHMDRYAFFRAGDPYFILVVKVSNRGLTPSAYIYTYGDEPWVRTLPVPAMGAAHAATGAGRDLHAGDRHGSGAAGTLPARQT